MLSRLLKSSIQPILRSSALKSSFKSASQLYKFQTAFYTPFKNFSSVASPEQTISNYKTQVNNALKEFIDKDVSSASDIIQVLDQLCRSKAGVNSADPLYREFFMKLTSVLKNKFDSESLEQIAQKASYLNIKDTLFWFSLDNIVKTSESKVDFETLLVISSIFLRVKAYPHFYRYMTGFQEEFHGAIKDILPQLELRHLIHASYIMAALEIPVHNLTKRLKSELRSSLKNPGSVDVSINDLAIAGVVVSSVLPENDADKAGLLNDLGHYLGTLDLTEFAIPPSGKTELAEGEFDEELLTWNSLGYLVRVYYPSSASQQSLIKKINDVILTKVEIDPIDFESASVILSTLVSLQKENQIAERVLQSVHAQLAEEGPLMFSQFDGRNVASFLKSGVVLANKGIQKEIVGEFIEYFSGLVFSDRIMTQIELEDYQTLAKVFESAKNVGNVDNKLFEHIKGRVELKAAQKQRYRN